VPDLSRAAVVDGRCTNARPPSPMTGVEAGGPFLAALLASPKAAVVASAGALLDRDSVDMRAAADLAENRRDHSEGAAPEPGRELPKGAAQLGH
jgi:hypothetical protein